MSLCSRKKKQPVTHSSTSVNVYVEGNPAIETRISLLEEQVADITQALADLGAAVQQSSSRVSATLDTLNAEIAALQAQNVDTTNLSQVAAQIEEQVNALNALDPATVVSDTGTTDVPVTTDVPATDGTTDAGAPSTVAAGVTDDGTTDASSPTTSPTAPPAEPVTEPVPDASSGGSAEPAQPTV